MDIDLKDIVEDDLDVLLTDEDEPFYRYIKSDKSQYKKASETINPKTGKNYIDPYDYILVDDNGHFLMNIDFTFIHTDAFRKAAITYKKTGRYTPYTINSIPYEKFRKREEYRRKYGMTARCRLNHDGTITDLHITGEFYNFLNYGRVQVLDEEALKANEEIIPTKSFDFPKFIDFQFWYTTVKNFAIHNGLNLITLKSRRKGASFMESIDSANALNLEPQKIVIHAAGDKKYIIKSGAITNMSYRQLIFYEQHTPFVRGGLDNYGRPKGLLSDNLEEIELGYKLKNGTKAGWGSTLFSVSTKNEPGAAVGKDAVKIKCDELNDFPNFSDFMSVTNPTVTTGAFKTGMISAFGTGGAKEGNWAEFESNYYNTIKYDFMTFGNVWDKDSENEGIGFFMPYWWGLQAVDLDGNWVLDEDGNTNYAVAIKISRVERKAKKLDSGIGRDYILFCSQFANRPSEAFNSGTETILTSLELKEHIKSVKIDKTLHFWTDGMVLNTAEGFRFRSNTWLESNNYVTHPYIEKVPFNSNEDFNGCTRMFHRPFTVDGEVPKNLYFATYDPVGSEINQGEIEDRHSLGCIQIWMAPNNISNSAGKILVASWVGRRDTQKEMDGIAMDLIEYYGCNILPEMDRGNVKTNFKVAGKLHRILPDPTEIELNRNVKSGSRKSFGMIIGSSGRKLDGVDYFKDFLYEKVSVDKNGKVLKRFHFIYDLPFLLEIDKFKFKGNFDRISAAILAMYQFNYYTAKKVKQYTKKRNKKNSLESLLLGKK
jgi:hypothetical protein